MNAHIKDYLNYYVTINDPRYAVLLNGAWGCGKTYFIKNLLSEWIKSPQQKYNDEDIVLKPIYISLNGVSSIKAVNYLIKKELSPILYSKGLQTAKKILFGTLKVATKINLDVDNDGKDDGSMSVDLNLINLLTNDDGKIKGDKVLIFDDIERCKIETDELLGYLNQFVEHNKCKIILIGDEDRIRELYDKQESEVHYKEFKEKLIGQTFSVRMDIDNALELFIEDCSDEIKHILKLHKQLVKDSFQTTATNNLRLLRQCFLEFQRFVNTIDVSIKGKDEYNEFIRQILVYFIIGYCEYKSGNEKIELFQTFFSDEAKEISSKYEHLLVSNKFRVSNYTLPFINIIEYIKESYIEPRLLNNIIINSECFRKDTLKSWERLWYYEELENDDFLTLEKEVKNQFFTLQVETVPELLHISGILLSIQQDGFDKLNRNYIVSKAKKNIDCIFKKHPTSIGFETRAMSLSYSKEYRNNKTEEFQSIFLYASEKDEKKRYLLRDNKMKDYFENLTDVSLDTIFSILGESLPDRSRAYSLTSIFQNISVEKLAKRIILLSNKSKYFFAQFIAYRYYLEGSGHRGTIYKYHTNDLDALINLKNVLEKKINRLKLIEKKATKAIINNIESAIDLLDRLKDTATDF